MRARRAINGAEPVTGDALSAKRPMPAFTSIFLCRSRAGSVEPRMYLKSAH